MHPEVLTIARRFNGPPGSANGGYVAGLLATMIGASATVRLSAPPPLERELTVVPDGTGCQLHDGDTVLARCRRDRPALTPPGAPTPDAAREASRRYHGGDDHTFSGCFVCGTAREPGDGLRVFAGALPQPHRVAAPWTPEAALAGPDGQVRPEFVWAALDCPGAFAIGAPPGQALLLGEMTAEVRGEVRPGAEHVVQGWLERIDGRKHFTGTALHDASGACLALARGTWFAVPVERLA